MPAALSFLALATAACVHMGGNNSDPTTAAARVVVVTNNGLSNVDVYAVRQGTRYHIGFVMAQMTAVLRVPPAGVEIGNDLELLVHQVGASGAGYTGTVHLDSDQAADLTLAPTLQFSTLSVRAR